MRGRLLGAFLLFAVVVAASLEIPLGFTMQAHARSGVLSELRRDGVSLSMVVGMALEHGEPHRAVEVAQRYAEATGRQVIVRGREGVVVSSGPGADRMSSSLGRVMRSAGRKVVLGETSGRALGRARFYVALPVPTGRHGSAVLLMTLPASALDNSVRRTWMLLGVIGFAVLLAATALGLLLSRSLLAPLRRIETTVTAIGKGHLGERAPTDDGPQELRNLAQVINVTAATLSRLLETQRSFVADASHQLRSPLTALRLRLERLQSTGSNEYETAAALAEAERLGRLVDALLALARNDASSQDLVAVDVGRVVEDRFEAWKPFADEQGIGFGIRLDLVGEKVQARMDAPEQMLDNLLANAFEATSAGGKVFIEARPAGEVVEIHVIDDGVGLRPEDRARAFDRFWRGPTATREGAGLGLAIVEQLVRLSGGSTELREADTGGVDAVVRLPRT